MRLFYPKSWQPSFDENKLSTSRRPVLACEPLLMTETANHVTGVSSRSLESPLHELDLLPKGRFSRPDKALMLHQCL